MKPILSYMLQARPDKPAWSPHKFVACAESVFVSADCWNEKNPPTTRSNCEPSSLCAMYAIGAPAALPSADPPCMSEVYDVLTSIGMGHREPGKASANTVCRASLVLSAASSEILHSNSSSATRPARGKHSGSPKSTEGAVSISRPEAKVWPTRPPTKACSAPADAGRLFAVESHTKTATQASLAGSMSGPSRKLATCARASNAKSSAGMLSYSCWHSTRHSATVFLSRAGTLQSTSKDTRRTTQTCRVPGKYSSADWPLRRENSRNVRTCSTHLHHSSSLCTASSISSASLPTADRAISAAAESTPSRMISALKSSSCSSLDTPMSELSIDCSDTPRFASIVLRITGVSTEASGTSC